MQKILLSFLLTGLLLFCFSQKQSDNNDAAQLKNYLAAEKIYLQAERLSLLAGDNEKIQATADEMYQQALAEYTHLIATSGKKNNDSIFFFTRLKTGFINYYFDSITAAKTDYLIAISLKKQLYSVPDSFLFLPYLYVGGIYYTQNQFDSALFYYKKAEQVNDSYENPLNEAERLYNRLGATFYEAGNYRKARNYFEKAIILTNPANNNLLANYKINLASIPVAAAALDVAASVASTTS